MNRKSQGYLEIIRARSHSASPLLGSQNSREFGNIVPSDFTPVLAKYSKSFNLIDTLAVGGQDPEELRTDASSRSKTGGKHRSPTSGPS